MEELIVLIVTAIGWLFGVGDTKPRPGIGRPAGFPPRPVPPSLQQQRRPPPPLPAQVWRPMPGVTVRAAGNVRRGTGRPGPPPLTRVAVAEPILTLTADTRAARPARAVARVQPVARTTMVPAAGRPSMATELRQQLTPAALRRQVVLSEILRPPLALRDGE